MLSIMHYYRVLLSSLHHDAGIKPVSSVMFGLLNLSLLWISPSTSICADELNKSRWKHLATEDMVTAIVYSVFVLGFSLEQQPFEEYPELITCATALGVGGV